MRYAGTMYALAVFLMGANLIAAEQAVHPSALPTALVSIGYVEAKLSDFVGTTAYGKRLADPTGYLAISADFRGDGHLDQARILRNLERKVAYVVVVSVRDKVDTYVVKSVPLAEADDLGIKASPPLRADHRAGLTIFALNGNRSETFDLIDDDFVERSERSTAP